MLTRIFITLFLGCFVIGETGADWLDGRMKHVVTTVPQKRSPFPLEEVRLLSGPFYEAQQRELTYLLTVQPDRLLAWFRKNAGLTPKAEVYGGWESRGCAGHSLGHYLSGCALMYASTNDSRLKEKVDYIVNELAECQIAGKTGLVCAIPEAERIFTEISRGKIHSKGFDLNGGWVPWYVLHKEFAGLLDAYRYCGNDQALEVVRKLGDWAVQITSQLNDEQFEIMLHCEFGGMNDVLAELYAITGSKSFLDLAHRFYHHRVLDSFAQEIDTLSGLHSNTQIPKFIGLARLYEMTNNETYRKAVEFYWERMVGFHSYVNGGNSLNEHLGEPGQLNDRLGPNTAETCNTYNMLKLTRHLYSWTGDLKYLDFYERGLFNHILASQNPEDGMVTYYMPLQSGCFKTYSNPFNNFTCCHGTGMENHAQYGDSIYFHSQDEQGNEILYVNEIIASELNWHEKKIKVRLITDFPDSGTVKLILKSEQKSNLKLKIRKPRNTICKNLNISGEWKSETQNIEDNHNQLIEIAGSLTGETTILLNFVADIHLESMPDNPNRVAFFYGPILLAADVGCVETPLTVIPVIVTENRKPESWLKRLSDKNIIFETIDVAKPNEVKFVPFYQLHHRRQAVYFDFYSKSSWQEHEATVRRLEEEKIQLERRTVDQFRIGEMQPERDHNLQGKNTRSGETRGMKWRDAVDGWFSFEMKIRPEKPQQLILTYWGSDHGNRTFDILIDNQKIATQTLNQQAPNRLFNVTHDLPSEWLQNKEKITVRLESHQGHTAGGLFGCRIVDYE